MHQRVCKKQERKNEVNVLIENQQFHVVDEGKSSGLSRVSVDDSCHWWGHSSLNGVVTACHDGKCLNCHVMSKFCSLFSLNKKTLSTEEFNIWIKTHECNSNRTKSSGSVESAGTIEIFSRFITKHNLICQESLGDGDTFSYKEVVDWKPYVNYSIIPEKSECVRHVQKQLGINPNKAGFLKVVFSGGSIWPLPPSFIFEEKLN